MIEVDRIMIEDLGIHLELMMEHAGFNFARLALLLSESSSPIFRIIAGSGNNGGGGLVAARRLSGWGYETEILLPRGKQSLGEVPKLQLQRAERMGVTVVDELKVLPLNRNNTVLDSYLGYGFKPREDKISEGVFSYLRAESNVISLDVPSGLDSTSGESQSRLKPKATMSIAFLKSGHLNSSQELVGDLYVADIGVPKDVYFSKLDILWETPFTTSGLDHLYAAFAEDSLQKTSVIPNSWSIVER
ncbi:MAG: NAD(P)H-hydrate epimerase [Candidatus Thorarchaeota archaeon]|jgi:NAD(P)H-hydrate epimerase